MNLPTEWRILIADGLHENGIEILRTAANVDDRTGIEAVELLDIIHAYDALIVRSRTRVTPGFLSAAGRLKVIGRAGVGVDNIDLTATRACGIRVVNSPTSTSLTVAELAIGLMFSLARSLPRADAAMKHGEWQKNALHGVELSGKTLGVIGVGKIGSMVAQRAIALGMFVVGYDILLTEDEIHSLGVQPVSLTDLFTQADFISLHIPLTLQTRHIIDATALAQMKSGVRLISTARGGLIDEQALLEALDSGQVAGVALDVFEQEPPGLCPLVLHPAVVATPHIGAQTQEAQARVAEDIANEVLAALRNEPLRWQMA